MARFARLLGSMFKSLGGWIVMPAVATAVGIVVWAPDEIARQYKFEKLRFDYGGWFFFAFWMTIALFASACTVQLLRLVRDKVVANYTVLRRRSAIRRTLADLTPDEVVVMFALLNSYADAFQAGPGCLVVRKLRLSGVVQERGTHWNLTQPHCRKSGGSCRASRNAGRRLSKLAASTLRNSCRREFVRSWRCQASSIYLSSGRKWPTRT